MTDAVPPLEISPREVKSKIEAGESLCLIDVREPYEYQLARIEGANLIPMNTVPQQLQTLDAQADQTPLIVFCHHGMRSLNVVTWLRKNGVGNCSSMSGGIDRWSLEVDSSIPRY